MADLHLSLMMSANDRSQPVLDGAIQPDGIDLLCTVGVRSNLKVLEAIADYSYDQGLTPRRVALEEVFAPSTLDL